VGPQSSGTENTLFGISFTDANTGTAVGGTFGQSEIFRTTDGGEHWIPQANPGRSSFSMSRLPTRTTERPWVITAQF